MEWTRGRTIGHGSSATVSVATIHHLGHIIAVKSAEFSRSLFLQREQQILSSLNNSSHPHVVTYLGHDITRENNKLMYNILMEYVPGGTLTEIIHNSHGGRFDESLVQYYTRQIVQGLDYLHSNGLVHCDIKGTNILVGEEGLKIADFGCARWENPAKDDAKEAAIGGTPMYMAPEVARGEEQGLACDVWSLGCTVIEMATGTSPWSNATDPFTVLNKLAYSNDLPEFPNILSEKAKDFLGKCLKRNPKERWTANQLLKHPFLEEFKIQESNSSSPTSILDQGMWNSLEESETQSNLVIKTSENSPAKDRLRRLSLFSGEPTWNWDQNRDWITIRGDNNEDNLVWSNGDVEVDMIGGSVTASVSSKIEQLESSFGYNSAGSLSFLGNYISARGRIDVSGVCNIRQKNKDAMCSMIFEKEREKLLLPFVSILLKS